MRKKLEKTEDTIFVIRNGVLYRKANVGRLLFCLPEENEREDFRER